jgi:hypothetical protein
MRPIPCDLSQARLADLIASHRPLLVANRCGKRVYFSQLRHAARLLQITAHLPHPRLAARRPFLAPSSGPVRARPLGR